MQEQITRVLVERLIVHRPHPWGLLITFIELIKNPRCPPPPPKRAPRGAIPFAVPTNGLTRAAAALLRYKFWSKGFTRCAPEIERLFESVARSCMAPGAAAGAAPCAVSVSDEAAAA